MGGIAVDACAADWRGVGGAPDDELDTDWPRVDATTADERAMACSLMSGIVCPLMFNSKFASFMFLSCSSCLLRSELLPLELLFEFMFKKCVSMSEHDHKELYNS